MSSGFGVFGGRGRCYTFWTDFKTCMAYSDDVKEECKVLLEDYHECLHHTKERERMKVLMKEKAKLRYRVEQLRREQLRTEREYPDGQVQYQGEE